MDIAPAQVVAYVRRTGHLFYNTNGKTSGFGKGGKFVKLPNRTTLTADDFLLIDPSTNISGDTPINQSTDTPINPSNNSTSSSGNQTSTNPFTPNPCASPQFSGADAFNSSSAFNVFI